MTPAKAHNYSAVPKLPGWRYALGLVLAFPLWWAITSGVGLLGSMFAGLLTTDDGHAVSLQPYPAALLLIQGFSMALTASLVQGLIWGRSLPQLGLSWKDGKHLAKAGALVAIFLLVQFGWISSLLQAVEYSHPQWPIGSLVGFVPVMFMVALGEEMLFRGVVLDGLPEILPLWVKWLTSAALFALAHSQNPGSNWQAMAGVFAGGLIMAANYTFTRNLWFGLAFHSVWNYLLGMVLGMPVSGYQLHAILQPRLRPGFSWLHGGTFGPEASLLVIMLLVATSMWLWQKWRRHYT